MLSNLSKVKMKNLLLILSILIIIFSVESYSNTDENSTIIAKVGNEEIKFGDLVKAFKKNVNNKDVELSSVGKDSLMNFLDLYINYRLKVHDAINRGFENDSSVKADLEQNRKILAESFYYDELLTKPNVETFINRRDTEYKIAIILSTFTKGNKTDTVLARENARKALNKVKAGEDFGKVALEFSNDRQSAENGGVIPNFITSGKVQRPIENAIYQTPVGEIYPELIKTKYGYFVLKVVEKQPRKLVKASHILLNLKMNSDTATINKKADSLIKVLKAGADFAEIAKEFSDDKTTAPNGGSLGSWYSRSTGLESTQRPLVENFEEELFKLKDGEISGKVYTEFGVHIIKREETKDYDEEEERKELKKMYRRLYFKEDKEALIDSLAKEMGFDINDVNVQRFAAQLNSEGTTLEDNWDENITDDLMNSVLFKIGDTQFLVKDMVEKMSIAPQLKGINTTESGIYKSINVVKEPIVFAEATKNLETEYPEFKELMAEFKDGILLFKVEAKEVWNKLQFDSTKAKEYYEKQNKTYYTEKQYDIQEVFLLSEEQANKIKKRLDNGEDFSAIAKQLTQRSGYREKEGKWGPVSIEREEIAKLADKNGIKKGEIAGPFKFEKGYSIIKVLDIQQPREKSFEEAIPDLAPEYQDMMQDKLTKEWLDKVKKDVKVKIYEDRIINIIES